MGTRTVREKAAKELMKEKFITERRVFAFLLAFFLLALIPAAVISFYAYPGADDFSYGVTAAHVWQETHSFGAVLSAAWEGMRDTYQNWQGSFAAVFLMYLQPAVFGTSRYFFGPLLLIFTYLSCSALLFYVISRRLFRCERLLSGVVTLTLLLLSFLFVYDPVEAFFWYNGGVYYTFFYSLSLLLFSLLLLSGTGKRKVVSACLYGVSLPLAFCIGGGNYSTALMSAVLLFLLTGFLAWKRRKKEALAAALVFASLMVSFVISISAPGNAVRQLAAGEPNSPVKAIFLSLVYGAYAFCSCTSLPVVAGWIFLTPILYRAVSKMKFSFSYPLLFFFLAYGVFCTQGTPVFYALGLSMPERVINTIYFSCYPVTLLVWSYFLGWLSHKSQWKECLDAGILRFRKQKGGLFSLILLLVFLAGTLGLIRVGKNPETGGVAMEGLPLSVQAVISLASGEAQDYHAQLLERETLYQNESLADVRVEPLKEKPYLLFQQDVTEDPNDWVNQAVAKYYHKESVALSGSTG